MKFLYVTAAVSCVHWLFASGQTQTSRGPIVNIGYAQYEGVYNSSVDINTWFGIRYAQPPTGELRWQAPQDIELNNNYSGAGILNATTQGPICVQGSPAWTLGNGPASTIPIGSEDCLLLDVLAPAHPASTDIPVMVQIHGGGYTQQNSEYSPGYALVNQSNGSLIHVSIQYRIGAYGFLSSSEIRENGVANAGLLDQRAALLWVQRHISAFGGDPSKVAIIGPSAGGGSVTNQMIMYGGVSHPPFRAAIAEYPWWQPYHNNTVLEFQYRQLLQNTNCSNLQCLCSVSAETLAIASQATYIQGYAAKPRMYYGYGDFYYGPSVDGEVIRDLPSNEFKRGRFTKVPLLTIRNGYEGYSFSNQSETTMEEEEADLQALFPYAKQSFFNRLFSLYPRESFNSTFFQRQTLFGDFIINCPSYYMATALSDWDIPVYKMIFSAGSQLHGATHPMLFNVSYGASPGDNGTIAAILKDYYISFATDLDPNAISYSGTPKPYWPTYQVEGSWKFSVMDVNSTMMGITPDYDASQRCDFYHGQSYVVRN